MSYLEIKGITKSFNGQPALNQVCAGIEKGELVCILGPSGCGKTTLLRIIAGLETADSGQIVINGADMTNAAPKDRNFGIVFQSYALFPNMTVLGNILFGLSQKKNMTKSQMKDRAYEVLRLVDLYEHKDKYPRQISGGQQQRTALARAIAPSPAYLLLDEPLSALDAKVRQKLRGEIRSIQKSLGITTIMVTHDQEEALTMADRIIVMQNAAVEQIGTPKEIYNNPQSLFVAGFVGSMNFYSDGEEVKGIRPEKMEPVDIHSSYDIATKVSFVEFRGALTRIYATTKDLIEICVDIPSDRADELCLSEDAMLYLKAPSHHMANWATAVSPA